MPWRPELLGAPGVLDSLTVAFLDRNPAADGHTLVVPRLHAEDIWAISEEAFAEVATATHAVARLIGERLTPDGVTLFQANRPAGWQDVFHLHVHVVPRWHGDGLLRPWGISASGRSGIEQVAERLGAEHRS